MKKRSHHAVRVTQPPKGAPLSRARKQFNDLIRQLDDERRRLAAWNEAVPAIRATFQQEYASLEQRFNTHQRELLMVFDQAYEHKSIGKKEREKLADLIISIALDLLEAGDDPEVKEIYKRYSGSDVDDEFAGEDDPEIKAMLTDIFGEAAYDDLDFDSPEALFEAMDKKLAERYAQETKAAADRPKPAKAAAREERRHAEEQRLKQSMREIYRKLASALHPDRETDADERDRKTVLMQRVNAAYAADDLLGLLELQLEIAQIDQAGLDNLSEDRIKQYNKILAEQVRELLRDNAELEYSFMVEIEVPIRGRLTPQAVMDALRADIEDQENSIAVLARQVREFKDVKMLKTWLKRYHVTREDDDIYGIDW